MVSGGVIHRSKGCTHTQVAESQSYAGSGGAAPSSCVVEALLSMPTAVVSQDPGGDVGQASWTNRNPGMLLLR